MVVKRLDTDFLQVSGPDGVILGMQFRNEGYTSGITALLEQAVSGERIK